MTKKEYSPIDRLSEYQNLIPVSAKVKELTKEERIIQMTPFLLRWYEKHKRILPWRENPVPYYVWISEIMLQQTRVEAVKPYFARFVKALPDIKALAAVEDEPLLKLWEGLGYYNRARNLKKAAQIVVEQYNGELPADYKKLLALPGIGSYTAGAIASIAYGLAFPAVDGNVLRVLSRLTADGSDIMKQSVRKDAEELLKKTTPEKAAAAFNQAMMEIGAVICLPNGEPLCEKCPLSPFCLAHACGTQLMYPVKKAKKDRRTEERTILLLHGAGGGIAIEKRAEEGLLSGLYEFPNLSGNLTEAEVCRYLSEHGLVCEEIKKLAPAKHIFSHVEWHMTGYEIAVREEHHLSGLRSDGLLFVELTRLREEYPVPNAFAAYKRYLGLIERKRKRREEE